MILKQYRKNDPIPLAGDDNIIDTATNVRRLIQLIQLLDTEKFVKSKKEINEINKKHKKILIKEKSWYNIFSENSGIFLLVFMAIGLIIGFGSRGYMMKRVEGGW